MKALNELTREEIVEALNSSGYITSDDEIISSEFRTFMNSNEAQYEITYNEDDIAAMDGSGYVYVKVVGGRFVAEF